MGMRFHDCFSWNIMFAALKSYNTVSTRFNYIQYFLPNWRQNICGIRLWWTRCRWRSLSLLHTDIYNYFHWEESEILMCTMTCEVYTLPPLNCLKPTFAVISSNHAQSCFESTIAARHHWTFMYRKHKIQLPLQSQLSWNGSYVNLNIHYQSHSIRCLLQSISTC